MATWNEKLPQWDNEGTEPTASKKTNGWQVSEKPPAGWLNWLFNRVYKCIQEIRTAFDTHVSDNSKQMPHLGTSTNSADAYSITTTETINANQKFTITFNAVSTSAPTLSLNGGTAYAIKKVNGNNAKLLASTYTLFWNGTNYVVLGAGTIDDSQIKNTLTETATGNVLDSAQGKVLNDRLVSVEKITVVNPETITVYTAGSFSSAPVKGQLNDLKIQGNTLNQLVNNGANYANWIIISGGTGSALSSSGIHLVDNLGAERVRLNVNVKPSTQYTLVYTVATTNMGSATLATEDVTANEAFPGSVTIAKTLGINKVLMTSNTTITNNCIGFKIGGGTGVETIDIKDVMLFEGDYTASALVNQPLKYGVVSILNERVKSIGKNQAQVNQRNGLQRVGTGSYTVNNNAIIASKTDTTSAGYFGIKVKVKPNTQYTVQFLSTVGISTSMYIHEYNQEPTDALANVITTYADKNNSGFTFTTGTNTNWIGIFSRCGTSFTGTYTISNIQLEYGSTATTYEPYTETLAYTPVDFVGRSLPNGIKDEFDVLTGVKTQRIGSIVLNGSETAWGIYGNQASQTTTIAFGLPVTGLLGNFGTINILSNTFASISGSNFYNNDVEGIVTDTTYGGEILIRILKSKLATVDVAGFKTWLASNNVSCIYQLSTPIPSYHPASNLVGGPFYTVSGEPYIHGENVYDSGVSLKGKVAKQMEWVTKFDSSGVFTPISDMTKVHLATDGTKFTVDGAVDEEFYEFGAFPVDGDSTNGQITATAPTSIAGVVNNNTDSICRLSEDNNDLHTQDSIMAQKLDAIELLYWMGV